MNHESIFFFLNMSTSISYIITLNVKKIRIYPLKMFSLKCYDFWVKKLSMDDKQSYSESNEKLWTISFSDPLIEKFQRRGVVNMEGVGNVWKRMKSNIVWPILNFLIVNWSISSFSFLHRLQCLFQVIVKCFQWRTLK